ncbi:Glycosylphosphatidylinositol anchor attachment 1 protein [Trichoplax sp. H2]|nr:Glycosylphosphatidylinositol anchor attachment 1 protein [Trichoplax sp. H2]|eukprot:RDD40080.1 Glycosylphosphatidylinositol anchor attachment 1 protein [Trichoplax sp. H2]
MGLLTDSTSRKRLHNLLFANWPILSILLYVIGIIWLLALALDDFNDRCYISENALMPAMTHTHYTNARDVTSMTSELTEMSSRTVPANWILEHFKKSGFDTFTQNFTYQRPFNYVKNKTITGMNVYGILRAPRKAGTEAIVLNVPYRPIHQIKQEATHAGLALMISLASYFQEKTYWSKDIIFLVTEREYYGLQAWLDSYYDTHIPGIEREELGGRGGSIQSAITLEIPSEYVESLNLKLEGVNGQLPNLDVFNMAVRICDREGITPTLPRPSYKSSTSYLKSLMTMLTMMSKHALGIPTGNHGLFLKYHIEAITLQGVLSDHSYISKMPNIGRAVEGIFRTADTQFLKKICEDAINDDKNVDNNQGSSKVNMEVAFYSHQHDFKYLLALVTLVYFSGIILYILPNTVWEQSIRYDVNPMVAINILDCFIKYKLFSGGIICSIHDAHSTTSAAEKRWAIQTISENPPFIDISSDPGMESTGSLKIVTKFHSVLLTALTEQQLIGVSNYPILCLVFWPINRCVRYHELEAHISSVDRKYSKGTILHAIPIHRPTQPDDDCCQNNL